MVYFKNQNNEITKKPNPNDIISTVKNNILKGGLKNWHFKYFLNQIPLGDYEKLLELSLVWLEICDEPNTFKYISK